MRRYFCVILFCIGYFSLYGQDTTQTHLTWGYIDTANVWKNMPYHEDSKIRLKLELDYIYPIVIPVYKDFMNLIKTYKGFEDLEKMYNVFCAYEYLLGDFYKPEIEVFMEIEWGKESKIRNRKIWWNNKLKKQIKKDPAYFDEYKEKKRQEFQEYIKNRKEMGVLTQKEEYIYESVNDYTEMIRCIRAAEAESEQPVQKSE